MKKLFLFIFKNIIISIFSTLILIGIIFIIISVDTATTKSITKSVVKIDITDCGYDYDNPWQTGEQSSRTGSGCIIDENRILTNAHVISNNTYIQVKKAGEARKYTAYVDAISNESDLATLKVYDTSFFKNSQPIKVGVLPKYRDNIVVYGFPTGGDELSITEGVISRIEEKYYSRSSANLLACQIDGTIKFGNSGGPVIMKDKIVGVVFQRSKKDENSGSMVPAPIIEHFLEDIADGKCDGFPELGILIQKMENPDLRENFLMKQNQTGVLIVDILFDSPAKNILKINDVIIAVEGINIENDGSIEFRKGERTSFSYIIQKKFINDPVTIRVLRNGEITDLVINLTVPMNSTRLVPYEQYDTAPTYYIAGGLVFVPLTTNYLRKWGDEWLSTAPIKLVNFYRYGLRSADRNQLIILSRVLPDEINLGYHDIKNIIIEKVNGKKISTMRDIVDAFEKNVGPFHTIKDDVGNNIILRKDKVDTDKTSSKILQAYRIESDRSKDLKQQDEK